MENNNVFPHAGARIQMKIPFSARGTITFGLVDDPNVRNLIILENNLK